MGLNYFLGLAEEKELPMILMFSLSLAAARILSLKAFRKAFSSLSELSSPVMI